MEAGKGLTSVCQRRSYRQPASPHWTVRCSPGLHLSCVRTHVYQARLSQSQLSTRRRKWSFEWRGGSQVTAGQPPHWLCCVWRTGELENTCTTGQSSRQLAGDGRKRNFPRVAVSLEHNYQQDENWELITAVVAINSHTVSRKFCLSYKIYLIWWTIYVILFNSSYHSPYSGITLQV